ncbi:MAG: alpha/beta fold hydrolase [Saprospiraceae bacterium]
MNLNFKTFGQGDPIIILHGLFGTLDNWQTLAKQLATNYTVYIVDQRNHGRSPHADEFNYHILAEDLHAFMENNWIYKARIIGHSMGGKTALQFALEYPDMVEQLVVVDMGLKAYQGGHAEIFAALLAMDVRSISDRKAAASFLEPRIPNLGVRQFLLKNLTRNKEGGYRWKMNLPVLHARYADILAAIESNEIFEEDALFIRGGQSNYVQTEDWEAIQQTFPQATLATVADAGHWVHAEKPQELLQLVTEFFAKK